MPPGSAPLRVDRLQCEDDVWSREGRAGDGSEAFRANLRSKAEDGCQCVTGLASLAKAAWLAGCDLAQYREERGDCKQIAGQPLLIWSGQQSRAREVETKKKDKNSNPSCSASQARMKKGTRPAALRSRLRATRLGVKQDHNDAIRALAPKRANALAAYLASRAVPVAILNPQKRLPVQRALVEARLVLKPSHVLYRSVCRDVQVGVARAREQRRLFPLRRCSSPCGHAARPTVLASAAVPVRRKKKGESFEPRTLHLSTPASTLVLSPRCPLSAGLRALDGDGCVLLTKASAVWRLWSSPSPLLALLYRTSQPLYCRPCIAAARWSLQRRRSVELQFFISLSPAPHYCPSLRRASTARLEPRGGHAFGLHRLSASPPLRCPHLNATPLWLPCPPLLDPRHLITLALALDLALPSSPSPTHSLSVTINCLSPPSPSRISSASSGKLSALNTPCHLHPTLDCTHFGLPARDSCIGSYQSSHLLTHTLVQLLVNLAFLSSPAPSPRLANIIIIISNHSHRHRSLYVQTTTTNIHPPAACIMLSR
ncbi:hypothetical protein L1887_54469 [Cichorium endivia]|nr:hypothetical protein L1887_54469 [Cichorium endivia]